MLTDVRLGLPVLAILSCFGAVLPLPAEPVWSPVTDPERLLSLRQVQRASQRASLCELRHNPTYAEQTSQVYRRPDRPESLVVYHCFLGADQASFELYRLRDKTLLPQPLTLYQDGSPPQPLSRYQFLGSLTFKSSGDLELLERCPGGGDCGGYGRYQWQGDDFQLVEFRSRWQPRHPALGRRSEPEPQYWPRLYPAVDRPGPSQQDPLGDRPASAP